MTTKNKLDIRATFASCITLLHIISKTQPFLVLQLDARADFKVNASNLFSTLEKHVCM